MLGVWFEEEYAFFLVGWFTGWGLFFFFLGFIGKVMIYGYYYIVVFRVLGVGFFF